MSDNFCPGCRRPLALRVARWMLCGPLLVALTAGVAAPFAVWFLSLSPLAFVMPSFLAGAPDVFLVLVLVVPWLLAAILGLGERALRDHLGRPVPAPVEGRPGYRQQTFDPRCATHRGDD